MNDFDTPIQGLEDGGVYYVLRVDDNTIRLFADQDSVLPPEGGGRVRRARRSTSLRQWTSSAPASVANTPCRPIECPGGVCIGASSRRRTRSTRRSRWPGRTSKKSGIGTNTCESPDSTASSVAGTLTGNIGSIESLLGLIELGLTAGGKIPPFPVQGTSSFGVAGAIVVNYAHHDVYMDLGSTARIDDRRWDRSLRRRSRSASQVASTASATKPQKKEGEEAKASVAIAIGLGIFENTAKATVHSAAKLDAHDTISVSATSSTRS